MKVVFRADGSASIGMGHVMRCLALAQALKKTGGEVIFVQAETTSALVDRLHAEAAVTVRIHAAAGSTDDATQTVALATRNGAKWIVADGYTFGTTWQRQIKDSGFLLLLLDDYGHARHYHADLILNQNGSPDPGLYASRDRHCRLLLGVSYALLRREFTSNPLCARTFEKPANRVLVTLGGADPANITSRVVGALIKEPSTEAIILVGGSNPHRDKLEAMLASYSSRLRLLINPPDIPGLMAWADVAVSAAGSTVWELAYMGLPAALIVIAENQIGTAEALHKNGVSLSLGSHRTLSSAKIIETVQSLLKNGALRSSMSLKGRQLVDGLGAMRVATQMLSAQIGLRRATVSDCALFWEWANDAEVRSHSFNSKSIPWETHVRWFNARLSDPNTLFFLAADIHGRPIGQIRFELNDERSAIIHISMARQHRAAGQGSAVIVRAVEELFSTAPVDAVSAFIKTDNHPSIRAFAKAGFSPFESTVNDHPTVHMRKLSP